MREEIIKMAKAAGIAQYGLGFTCWEGQLERFFHMAQAAERKELEQELLKLGKGVASISDYIQGRWDLIGEFQDIIRARGEQA